MVNNKKIVAYWKGNPIPTNYKGSGFKNISEMNKFAQQLKGSGWKKVKIVSNK